ncbi:MAG TPA: YkvA family protein [Candidatus Limnocylindria bacterium]
MDPFPTERFGALVRRLPAYGRLAWRLARDRRIGGTRRAAVFGAAAYLASPIDLVPGIIPVAGQLDDAAVALMGLRYALGGLPPTERRAYLDAVGLVEEDLDRDLATVWMGAAWIARRGGRLALRGGRAAARGAWRAARGLGRRLRP